MTAKKLLIIIASILAGLILLAMLFVGAIVGTIFYSIGHSEAAATAENFLRNNERLRREIGEVRDFGSLVTGSINSHNLDGDATLRIKVIGARETGYAKVDMMYINGRSWRVTGASYANQSGANIDLLNEYAPTTSP